MNGAAVLIVGALLSAATAFTLRLAACRGGRFRGADTWFHLHVADCIRETGRIPRRLERFTPTGVYDYPPGLAWLLSRFAKDVAQAWQWLVSPAADAAQAALTLAIAWYLWRNAAAAVAAGFIYAISPLVMAQSLELTPRALGSLLLAGAVSLAIIASQAGHTAAIVAFAGAVVCAGLLLMTHRMGTQALLFVAAGIAAAGNLAVLASLAAAVAITMLMTRGRYVTILGGHLAELRFWFRNLHRRDDNRPLKLLSQAAEAARPRRGLLRRSAAQAYSLVRHLPFVLVFAYGSWRFWAIAPLSRPFVIWVATAYAAFLVTTHIRALKFLGQGYRYLTYAALPVAAISGGALFAAPKGWPPVHVYAAAGLALAISLREVYGWYGWAERHATETLNPALMSVLDCLREQSEDGVVCVPFGLANSVAYFTGKRVLRHGAAAALPQVEFFYPLVQEPLDSVVARVGASWLLADVRSFPPGFVVTCGEVAFEQHPYRLFRVAARREDSAATGATAAAAEGFDEVGRARERPEVV